jgi:hypothetical protein
MYLYEGTKINNVGYVHVEGELTPIQIMDLILAEKIESSLSIVKRDIEMVSA